MQKMKQLIAGGLRRDIDDSERCYDAEVVEAPGRMCRSTIYELPLGYIHMIILAFRYVVKRVVKVNP